MAAIPAIAPMMPISKHGTQGKRGRDEKHGSEDPPLQRKEWNWIPHGAEAHVCQVDEWQSLKRRPVRNVAPLDILKA
jgi:hypothetical protein